MINFFYGQDDFRILEKIKKEKENIKNQGGNFLEVSSFSDFKNQDKKFSLFGDKKAFFIRNPEEDFLDFKNSNFTVFFYFLNPDKRNKIFKHLKSISNYSEEFILLNLSEVKNWILNQKYSISDQAADMLVNYLGNDLWSIKNALDKLSAYIGYNNSVSAREVEVLVKPNFSPNIFKTIEFLSKREKKQALRQIFEHLKRGDDENYLFNMFIWQFEILLKIKIGETQGIHPFIIKKNQPIADLYSQIELKEIYSRLLRLDYLLKIGQVERPATFFCLLCQS